ncbi:glycine zipper 2TM domain-containing protein [Pseudomonas delhiensis]|uniref:glycine zipper 2TM domain-containing protein n=1 Tax=Pseudomonas delhiensis TaxID=366289 RepID=UPI00315B265F
MKASILKSPRSLLLAAFVGSALALSGCASDLSGSSYSRADARAVQTVRMGTVESLRAVRIEGTKTPIGTLAGAAVGGIAGSGIGGGRGAAIATILGGVAGGAAGSAIEEGVTRSQGVEIVVREDDGISRAYVQAVDPAQVFRVGDRVRVMSVNGASRVTL